MVGMFELIILLGSLHRSACIAVRGRFVRSRREETGNIQTTIQVEQFEERNITTSRLVLSRHDFGLFFGRCMMFQLAGSYPLASFNRVSNIWMRFQFG